MSGITECHRCKKCVYAAEERRALGYSWHSTCYICGACGKGLDSKTLEEHRELDEIYCTCCYKRLFATVAYGASRNSFSAVKVCNCCAGEANRRSSLCPNTIFLELKDKKDRERDRGDFKVSPSPVRNKSLPLQVKQCKEKAD